MRRKHSLSRPYGAPDTASGLTDIGEKITDRPDISSRIAVKEPENYEATSNIMWTATYFLEEYHGNYDVIFLDYDKSS